MNIDSKTSQSNLSSPVEIKTLLQKHFLEMGVQIKSSN